MRRARLAVILSLLAGCAGPGEAGSPVATAQFDDVPVPDGMEYLPSRSHSYEITGFRTGHFEYFGSTPVAEVAAYMRKRMPLDGWTLDGAPIDTPNRVRLEFSRDRYRCVCTTHRDESYSTHLTVEYSTQDAR